MASRSSQPKNALRVSLDHARALLDDGGIVERPSDDIISAAKRVSDLGIIQCRSCEYVRCADPRDSDFPPPNRNCDGRIVLVEGEDEDGGDIRCPKCERCVRPHTHKKMRHPILMVSVIQEGALAWLRSRLSEISDEVVALERGAWHVRGFGTLGVTVCIVDIDGDAESKFNRRDWAATNPVCYVTINPRVPDARIISDDWLNRVTLAELIAETTDLRAILEKCDSATAASHLSKVDVPVFSKGHVPIQPKDLPHKDRVFVVELRAKSVLINDVIVVKPQAGPRLTVFCLLWKAFLGDIARNTHADLFKTLSMKQLMKAMKDAGHVYNDETKLRRVINNLQADIEKSVKRQLGIPIDREDIIQTCRMTGQSDRSGGYRINPVSVAIRPVQRRENADLS